MSAFSWQNISTLTDATVVIKVFLAEEDMTGGASTLWMPWQRVCLSIKIQQTCSAQFYNIDKQTAPNVNCPTLEFHLIVVNSGQKVFDMCGQMAVLLLCRRTTN